MRTGRHKALFFILTIATSLVLLLLLALPKLLNLNRYRVPLENLVGDALGVQLQLGSLRWGFNLPNSIWVEAETLSIKGSLPPSVSLDCGRVVVKIAVSPLLQKRLIIRDILLQNAVLELAPTDDNAQPGKADDQSDGKGTSAYSLELESLRIEDGQVLYFDQHSDNRVPKLHFKEITAKATQAAPETPVNFELALRQTSPELEALGRLNARGSLLGLTPEFSLDKPSLEIAATLDEVATEALQPWLTNELAARLGGSLSATIDYQGWPLAHGTFSGQIDLGQFSYHDPALSQDPLNGSPATLQFSALSQDDQIQFDDITLAVNGMAAEARLTLGKLAQRAVLSDVSLSAEIPLESAGPWVPWLKLEDYQTQLRDLLAGGGTVYIKGLQLPEFELATGENSAKNLFKALSGSIELSKLSAQPFTTLPRFENINGHFSIANGAISSNDIRAKIGPLSLPVITVEGTTLLDDPRFVVKASGPLSLAASSAGQVRELLAPYHLSELSADATVALELDYDSARPDEWRADGSVMVNHLQLTTLGKGNQLSMQGRVELKREEDLHLRFDGVKGAMNGAPLRIDGALGRSREGALLVDLEVVTSNLELAQLADAIPPLQTLAAKGRVDADVTIFYDASRVSETRLKGAVSVKQLALQAGDFTIDRLNTQLRLAGKQVATQDTSLRVNQQPVSVSGNLRLDPRLRGRLHISSPTLKLDQLIGPTENASTLAPALAGDFQNTTQLPALLRDATLDITGDVVKGAYRGLEFSDLKLRIDYDREVARDHELSAVIAGGTANSSGQVILKDLSRIEFDTHFELADVHLEELLPAIVGHPTAVSGPFSSAGRIAGTGGSGILESLRGNVNIDAGPGRMAGVGPLTKTMFHVLEVINLEGIIEGTMGEGLAQKGIRFESLTVVMELDQQGMRITRSNLLTPAFNSNAKGLVDFGSNSLDVDVELAVLGTLDKVVGLVPLVGTAASNITKVYLLVKGPLEKPRVIVRPGQGVIETVKEGIKDPAREITRGLDSLFDLLDGKGDKRN